MWWQSVRSLAALMVVGTYCYGFVDKIVSAEAFTGTVGAIVTFYFLKNRTESNGGVGKS